MIYYNDFLRLQQQQEGGELKQTVLVGKEEAGQARAKSFSLYDWVFFPPFSGGGRVGGILTFTLEIC